jgi:SAM-dependent methyltransferase
MHISRFICFLVISALFLDSPSKAAEYNRLAPIHPSEKSAVVLASEWAHKCDLADRDFLENIIDPAFKNDLKLIDFAAKLLEGFKCQRSVGDGKYGQEFIPHHEVLMQLMKISKGKVVCELAAGSGINSIFLALGGAETVYVNDIVQSEMDALINRICSLSEQFKSRIKVIPGDAFSVLKDIYGTCDIVYARNFIHLFPKSEVLKFFNLLKDIVRPTGGTIVLSAHGSRERITGVWDSNVKKVSGYSYCRNT